MPERKDLHFITVNSVVKMVVNSSEVYAPYASGLGIQRRGADGGLRAEEQKRFSQFLLQRPGSQWTIFPPPSCGLLYVRVGSPGDPNAHG